MFLLDDNAFIYAKRDYYPFERVPEYWDWLLHQAQTGKVKAPKQVIEEILKQEDELKDWATTNRSDLQLSGADLDAHVTEVLGCYCDDLSESEIEGLGADPFLIAAARKVNWCVVSKENSKPTALRTNRKVPDICKTMQVRCITDFQFISELDFSTRWRA